MGFLFIVIIYLVTGESLRYTARDMEIIRKEAKVQGKVFML